MVLMELPFHLVVRDLSSMGSASNSAVYRQRREMARSAQRELIGRASLKRREGCLQE